MNFQIAYTKQRVYARVNPENKNARELLKLLKQTFAHANTLKSLANDKLKTAPSNPTQYGNIPVISRLVNVIFRPLGRLWNLFFNKHLVGEYLQQIRYKLMAQGYTEVFFRESNLEGILANTINDWRLTQCSRENLKQTVYNPLLSQKTCGNVDDNERLRAAIIQAVLAIKEKHWC